MTLKQRLAELLPHFDDDGKLLPNKTLLYRSSPASEWRPAAYIRIAVILDSIESFGYEFKIEDDPKRNREVTEDEVTEAVMSYTGFGGGAFEAMKIVLQNYEDSRSK